MVIQVFFVKYDIYCYIINTMKKFIISEEEKSRILGMHQDATKRHYLNEQQTKVNDKMAGFKNNLAKVNEFLPIDLKMVKDVYVKLKDEDTPVNEIIQPFDTSDGQKLIEKINKKGYDMATNSEWESYESVTTGGRTNSHRSTWEYALADIINVKTALNAKAQELAGGPAKYPSWVTKNPGTFKYFVEQSGLMA